MTPKSDSVWFTTKGQVVIPARLRREFHIENGTRAIVQATPEGILLRPVTKHAIARLRGEEIARELPALPIEFHSASRSLADAAADLKARYKLSLADAFAAALAKEKKAQLVTGDQEFQALDKEIKIGWLE